MISYPEANFVQDFSVELFENAKGLPLYEEGPGVSYTGAMHAYALNATLLYDPQCEPKDVLAIGPSEAAQIMLVERASGHGEIGSFSGVSGYMFATHEQPTTEDVDGIFDPVAHTLREELETECGFTDESFGLVDFYAGKPTVEARTITKGAKITVVPILGLCVQVPTVLVNKAELASYKWVELRNIRHTEKLARGYLEVTLPSALGAIGVRAMER